MPQKLTEVKQPINALWIGEGGTGKTTALASLANLGRVLAINAEAGIEAGALKKRGVDVDNIEVFPGPGEEITQPALEKLVLGVREDLHKDPESWAGVIVDPISEIQVRFVEDLVKESVERASRSGRDRSRWVKDQDNWTTANSQMRNLIRDLRDLPCHFGMSAPLRRVVDDDGAVTYAPGVSASLQNDLFGWVAVVCVTSVSQVQDVDEYRGLFGSYGKWLGKDRLSVLPKWLVDPTFDRIISYRDGDLTVDSDPIMQEARERAKQTADEAAEKTRDQMKEAA